jgi:hypothetical protein
LEAIGSDGLEVAAPSVALEQCPVPAPWKAGDLVGRFTERNQDSIAEGHIRGVVEHLI